MARGFDDLRHVERLHSSKRIAHLFCAFICDEVCRAVCGQALVLVELVLQLYRLVDFDMEVAHQAFGLIQMASICLTSGRCVVCSPSHER